MWPLRVCRPVAPGLLRVVLDEDGGGTSSHCPPSSGSLTPGPWGTLLPVPWDSYQLVGPGGGTARPLSRRGPIPRASPWVAGRSLPPSVPTQGRPCAGGGLGLCCGSRGFVFTRTALTVLGGLGVFTVSPGGPALPSRREGTPCPDFRSLSRRGRGSRRPSTSTTPTSWAGRAPCRRTARPKA